MTTTRKRRLPSASAAAVIADWPAEDWITEGELAELLPEAHEVTVTAYGLCVAEGRTLRGVLSEARRAGWLIRNQRVDPAVYTRTDQGATEAALVLATRDAS